MGPHFRKAFGADAGPAIHRYDGEVDDSDPYSDNGDEADESWDHSEIAAEGEAPA